MYPLVALLTVVRIEPAPVDFLVIGLASALAMRGELWRFRLPRMAVLGGALILFAYAAAIALSHPSAVSARFTAGTLLVVVTGYVAFQLISRESSIVDRAWLLAVTVLVLETAAAFLPIPGATVLHGVQMPRVQGLFKDPNVFGPFAVPAVLLLGLQWRRTPMALRAAGLALALIPVAAALSRGAVVVLVVSLVVLVGTVTPKRWRPAMIAILSVLGIAAFALLVVLALPGTLLGAQRGLTTAQPLLFYDLTIRFTGQAAGLNYLLAHPGSLGVGPGNYDIALSQPSHETYLRMLVETGPFSLMGLFLLFWAAVRALRISARSSVAWVSALVGFMIAGFFIDTLHWRHLWVMLAIPLAIAAQNEVQRHRAALATVGPSRAL